MTSPIFHWENPLVPRGPQARPARPEAGGRLDPSLRLPVELGHHVARANWVRGIEGMGNGYGDMKVS